MYVAVTGASGFIGSHVVAALRKKDHRVRCVVRNVTKTASALEMHGLTGDDAIDVVEADLTDAAAMKVGLDGVDAVVHTAAVFSLNPNDAAMMNEINPESVRTVISIATELGLEKIVYVSTMGVYIPAPADHIDADTALSTGCGPYTESKIAAEAVARSAAADGAPLVTVYPGAVFGPIDPNPKLSDSQVVIRDALKGRIPAALDGASLTVIDVRDVATVCARAVDGGTHQRYLLPGEKMPFTDLFDAMNEATGRSLKLRTLPKMAFTLTGKASDLISRITKRKMPVTDESVKMLVAGAESRHVTYGWDPAKDDFGVPNYDLKSTIRDSAIWLHGAGHLNDKDVGSLAS